MVISPVNEPRRHEFLLTNSVSGRFWEGHDFSRAAKSSEISRALALEVCFPPANMSFQPPASDNPQSQPRKHFPRAKQNRRATDR